MTPYFILLLVVVFFGFLYQKFQRVRGLSNFINAILLLILILFAGLRNSSVGTDTNNYIGSFYFHHSEGNIFKIQSSVEIGYLFLERLVQQITNQYWVLLTVIALIVIYFYYKTIIKLSDNIPLSLFVFITLGNYLFFFNGARQGIAAAIFSFSIIYLLQNNFKKYLFWIGIAFLFHKTVIITLPMYFLLKRKFSFKNLFILTLLFTLIIASTWNILSYLPESIASRYSAYENRGSSGGVLLTVFYLIITSFFVFFRQFVSKRNLKIYDVYLNMTIINTLIYIIVYIAKLDVNLLRLSLYFSLGFVLIWPIIFREINVKLKPLLFIFFVLGHLSFYYIYLGKMASLTPYIFNQTLFSNF